jgi:heme exporter protein D
MFRVAWKDRAVEFFAGGQVTFGLWQSVWVAVAAVAVSIVGSLIYS